MIGAATPALLPGRVKHVAGPPTQEVAAFSPSLPTTDFLEESDAFEFPFPSFSNFLSGLQSPSLFHFVRGCNPSHSFLPHSENPPFDSQARDHSFPAACFTFKFTPPTNGLRATLDSPSHPPDFYPSVHLPSPRHNDITMLGIRSLTLLSLAAVASTQAISSLDKCGVSPRLPLRKDVTDNPTARLLRQCVEPGRQLQLRGHGLQLPVPRRLVFRWNP
jgi:hypothetical protein